MPLQVLAVVATLVSIAPHGNRIELKLDHGGAELEWVSASTFRYRRVLNGALSASGDAAGDTAAEAVAITVKDEGADVKLRSRAIEVTIHKQGVALTVKKLDGTPLMADAAEPRSEAGGMVWERQTGAASSFYGLGPRAEAAFDLRGRSMRAEAPFLFCTAGYGEYHPGAGTYHFEFMDGGKYRVTGPELDYYFYYGPTPKEVFEERNGQPHHTEPWMVSTERFGSWATLKASMSKIVQGSMSAAISPIFDLAPYNTAPANLQARARQLGSLVARVQAGTVGLSGFRKQLDTFYGSYVAELQDRGFPVWHPLPLQFPDDAEGARHADEFMLGDEMLIAPIYEPGETRSVYLPRGVWTNLETNAATKGPATITVTTPSLPVFARNGAIVPLDAATGMGLHYFPNNGGEFFLLEGDLAVYSQAHAAPALDMVRLEIESKKDRDYQWVVHHVEKPKSVEFDEKQYREVAEVAALKDRTWYYDAALKNLHVRVKVKAGEDCIINLNFE